LFLLFIGLLIKEWVPESVAEAIGAANKEAGMEWYKFTISDAQIAPIVTQKLKEKFEQIFWPLSCPEGAAVYTKKSESGSGTEFYLTPSCGRSARALISTCSAKACEKPDMDSLMFLAGDSSFSS
jgi:hypothetical protein